MLENELVKIWKGSTPEEKIKLDKAKLILELDHELGRFEKALNRRDRLEIAVAIILIPYFGIAAYHTEATLTKVALALVILPCVFTIYMLLSFKKYRVSDYSLPIKEFLSMQRENLKKQRWLINNVLYWYILPPAICLTLFYISLKMPTPKLLLFLGGSYAVMVFIFFLNKRSVKTDFDPVIRKIDDALMRFDEDTTLL